MSTQGCPFDDPASHCWEQRRRSRVTGQLLGIAEVESTESASVESTESASVESTESADLRMRLDQILFTPSVRRVPSGTRFSEIRPVAARLDRYYEDLRKYGVNSIGDLRDMLEFGIANNDALPGQICLLDEDKEVLLKWYRDGVTSGHLVDYVETETHHGSEEEDSEEEDSEESVQVKTIVKEMGEILLDIRVKVSDDEYLRLVNGLQRISNIVDR